MKDGGALTHVPHGHPELVSGSEDSYNQMQNQVQHDTMMKDGGGRRRKNLRHLRHPRLKNHAVSVILTIPLSRNQIRFSMSIANNLFQHLSQLIVLFCFQMLKQVQHDLIKV